MGSINLDQIQALDKFNFINLYNDANQNDLINDSPFVPNNSCDYYSPEEFGRSFQHYKKSQSFFCINCRSLNYHWDALREFLLMINSDGFLFDFIGLTEVFQIRNDTNYTLDGYHQLEFNVRPEADDGRGGVALFVKDHLNYFRREDLSIFIPHVIESIFIEVQNNRSKPFIVGIIYRPNTFPLADLDRFISELLEVQSKIASENKIAYLMGDYNINLLKFNTHQKTNDFIDNVISQGFIPHITKPTRVTTDSATLIDHIYSNRTYSNHSSGIIITDIADHFGSFHITHEATQKHKPIFLPKRQLRDDNLLAFGRLLITTDFSPVIQALDPDEAYNIFIGIYTLAFDKACPIKYTRIKSKLIKREPWITQGLLTSIIHKSKLFRKKMTKPTEHNINYYRIYCNIFNKLKCLAKAHYYSDMLHIYRNNIKKTWITQGGSL